MSAEKSNFDKLVETVKALRDPETGCPWDIEQTHLSIRPYAIEETYEMIEAIENGDDKELCEELGDVLLQVVLHAQIAKDRNAFNIEDVARAVNQKMIKRHPHVFGDVNLKNAEAVKKNWEAVKQKEKEQKENKSLLSGVPKGMPALTRSERLGEKAGRLNFDWDNVRGVWEKVEEEISELKAEASPHFELNSVIDRKIEEKDLKKLEHEIGDALFSICQLSRWLGIHPEESLRACCDRFQDRFEKMEQKLTKPLSECSTEELEEVWQSVK